MKLKTISYLGAFFVAALSCSDALCQNSLSDTAISDNLVMRDNKSVKGNQLFFDAEKAKSHNDSKKATDLFEQFVAFSPQSAAGYFQLSQLYYGDKKVEKAEDAIKKAISLSPENLWYKHEYATQLAGQSKFAEAAKLMAEVADKEAADVNLAMLAADYYEKAQKYPEAITYIDKALTRSGTDEDILMHKVQVYLHMNEVDKAAGVINELISQDPRNGKYYKLLGELYDNNKMPDKGQKVFETAEKKLPGDPAIELGLSEHYLNLHDTAHFRMYAKKAIVNNLLDAESQVQLFDAYIQNMSDSAQIAEGMPLAGQLLAQHPNDALLLALYGDFLYSAHKQDSAVIDYKKSLAIKPAAMEVWERLLSAYSEKDKADSLLKYSAKEIRLFPNQYRAHYFNALGYYNKKEYPAATKALKRAIDMVPDTDGKTLAELYGFLGEIYNSSKQFDESDKAFDKSLETQPDNPFVLNNYSYFLSERGVKLDAAQAMSQKSLVLRPNEPTYMDTYGWILYKKGEFEQAKESILNAINASSKNIDAALYDHLGDVYFKLNDKAKAVQNWKLAKEKGCDNPLLTKKIAEEKLYE